MLEIVLSKGLVLGIIIALSIVIGYIIRCIVDTIIDYVNLVREEKDRELKRHRSMNWDVVTLDKETWEHKNEGASE